MTRGNYSRVSHIWITINTGLGRPEQEKEVEAKSRDRSTATYYARKVQAKQGRETKIMWEEEKVFRFHHTPPRANDNEPGGNTQ